MFIVMNIIKDANAVKVLIIVMNLVIIAIENFVLIVQKKNMMIMEFTKNIVNIV